MFLGEVKALPIDIISFSLGHISKSKDQTSNPSSSPASLDTPAWPADSSIPPVEGSHISKFEDAPLSKNCNSAFQ